jgi:hypothetical protein
MGDQGTGGVQNFTDQYIKSVTSPTPQQAPPPGTAIAGTIAPRPPPPDYSTLGTGQQKPTSRPPPPQAAGSSTPWPWTK